jgi:hypothetical protein
MLVEVYHQKHLGTSQARFDHVATVNAQNHDDINTALEFAWRSTQNIDGSWSTYGSPDWNPLTTVRLPLPTNAQGQTIGLRSSCVGDMFKVGDRTFYCADFGFEEARAQDAD